MIRIAGFALFSLRLLATDYTTYIGGSFSGFSPSYDVKVTAMTTDAAGNTYLTGSLSTDTLHNTTTPPPFTAFVTKLDPAGQIVFSKIFGGSGSDQGTAIVLDPTGNIYVAGSAGSPDLAVSNALQTQPSSIFILKLSSDGKSVLYLTYFGGAGGAAGSVGSLATDSVGNLYLTGTTFASDFPTTPGMPTAILNLRRQGGFITEISAAGDHIVYSGVLGGGEPACPIFPPMAELTCADILGITSGVAIAVDSSGNAYVAGNTDTTGLPTTSGVLTPQGIGAFVVKINSGGTGIAYLTYIGSANYFATFNPQPANVVHAMAIDSTGSVYLVGSTNDPKFPATPGAYQTALANPTAVDQYGNPIADGFLAKLAPDAGRLVWATYLGGEATDSAQSIAVDLSGDVWTTGTTDSVGFPNPNGWSSGSDFLAEMDSSGATLLYAGRYPNQTVAQSVALDSTTGLVHVAGPTGIVSGIAPSQAPTTRIFGLVSLAGGETTGRVTSGEMVSIYGPHIGPPVAVTGAANSSGALPSALGGVQVWFGGQAYASLLYVSDSRIDAILPNVSAAADMQIVSGGNVSPAFPVMTEKALPNVFLNPDGRAAAINQDGSINSASNPAKTGSVVAIWATGTGYLPEAAGEITTAANNSCNVECQINVYGSLIPGPFAQQAEVLYAGASPGYASGFTEIVFRIPSGIPYFYFNLSVNGFGTNPVSLYVTNQ